jgi:ParB family chromosome partitioning protein
MYLKEKPEMNEDDGQMMDSIEFAYYVTLGIAYEKLPRLFGSAYESILKKIDFFLSKPLKNAIKEREERAEILIETDNIAREAIEKIKEIGIDHPFLYKEVVSFCTPVKRKRKVEQSFNEMFNTLKENLKNLISNPHKIREHKFSTMIEI